MVDHPPGLSKYRSTLLVDQAMAQAAAIDARPGWGVPKIQIKVSLKVERLKGGGGGGGPEDDPRGLLRRLLDRVRAWRR